MDEVRPYANPSQNFDSARAKLTSEGNVNIASNNVNKTNIINSYAHEDICSRIERILGTSIVPDARLGTRLDKPPCFPGTRSDKLLDQLSS
jgi:hypothetical protein